MKNTRYCLMPALISAIYLLGSAAAHCFWNSDGRGDAVAAANYATAKALPQCRHGPSGEVIRAMEPKAKANPFRFLIKQQDGRSRLLYYGYRYYNASTGRWMSRDPMEERGGIGLYIVVGNDAVNRSDRLGLRDFEWRTPVYENRPPVPVAGGEVQFGGTSWRVFRPVVKVYQRPSDPCCYGLMFDGEYAQVTAWWVAGDSQARGHELYHVLHHMYPAYLGYKGEAASYFSPCKTQRVANCLAGAIAGPLATEYTSLGLAIGLDFDCRSYGGQICQAADQAIQAYLDAALAARTAIAACLSMP